jgi:hypothetical protein
VSSRASFGGGIPPDAAPGVMHGILIEDGHGGWMRTGGSGLAGYLEEQEAWKTETLRRADVRGITVDTPHANLLLDMGDDEYAEHVARKAAE